MNDTATLAPSARHAPTLAGPSDGTLTLDRHGRIARIDRTAAAILGGDPGTLAGTSIGEHFSEAAVRTLDLALASYLCLGGNGPGVPYRLPNVLLPDRSLLNRRVELTVRHVHLRGAPHTAVVVRDVSDQSLGDARRDGELARFRTLAKLAPVGIVQLDGGGACVYANDLWCELSGLGVDASAGRGWLDALHPEDAAGALTDLRVETTRNRVLRRDLRLRSPHGRITWVTLGMTVMQDETGHHSGSLLVITDIDESRRRLERLDRLAHTDPLTGLANRTACLERLERLLDVDADAGTDADSGRVAVLYTDLDGFKAVNDTFGHGSGDELLQAVAGRLRAVVRPEDTVARLGGDEFAVLMPGLSDPAAAAAVAQRIVDALGEPFAIDRDDVRIGASVGIALGEAGASEHAALLARADAALYTAKRGGRARYALFGDEAAW